MTMQNRIFSMDSAKAVKAQGFGWLNAIHYMSPANVAGVGNLCPHASAGCMALCLGLTSGQAGIVSNIDDASEQGNKCRKSRADKAKRFMHDRANYMRDVVRSIELAQRKAQREGLQLCVRMNGSTDIAWEGIACRRITKHRDDCGVYLDVTVYRNVFEAFPEVTFVDYTKNPSRMYRKLPANYHLTFSRSETNIQNALDILESGRNVAVVFAGPKPATFYGFTVVDGDAHDLRHLDPRGPKGFVIGLTPKGRKAKKDMSGFVVR